ncbi:MAG: hypothetical protein ACXW5U_14705 [Thermoanaerobaculia bacterium]
MASLSANQQSFIEMMKWSVEHATHGFALLLSRPQFLDFFEPLIEAGLFAPENNPAPVQVDEEGRYRIPYWKALDYLIACANVAGQRNDAVLADKILSIVRTLSTERDPVGARANCYTLHAFAEILGLLPTSTVTTDDIALVEGWLNAKFDHGMVANAIDDGALPRFLNSGVPADWAKAVQVFQYCTAIRWQPARFDSETREPVTVVDEHWLKDLVTHHAAALGRKAGASAASLMADRVREVFSEGGRADWSYIYRPAVEDDGQRHVRRAPENIVVEGLSSVLLGWTDVDTAAAKPFVDDLLRSNNEMSRRIGIHVLNERWKALGDLYLPLARPELFRIGHFHEVYRLLHLRFESFSDEEKAATMDALRNSPHPYADEAEVSQGEHLRFRWLNAIAGTAYEPAAKWFADLTTKFGAPPRHPDYLSYIESRWGPGPSPYGAEELVALAEQGTLVQKLTAVKPSSPWEGPTVDALTDQVERAVQLAPLAFIRVLPGLQAISITYQHAVIAGFERLWREPDSEGRFEGWDDAWPKLFDFFDALLARATFWDEKGIAHAFSEVTPMWIASSLADLLQAGTRDDNRAYPAALLPRGWALLQTLLAHAEAVSEPSDDPMFQATNSARGRALEAVFGHALRVCRLADDEAGSHRKAWNSLQVLFDSELAACRNGNFEFSTLAGAYSGNLAYLSFDWLEANIGDIFPPDRHANLVCAIGGLAYASINRKVYQLLRDKGVLDAALRLDAKGLHGDDRLVERVAVGYLWGEDTLDSSRFSFIFASKAEVALEQINFFFRTIRREELNNEEVERILLYWRRCLDWAGRQPTPPVKVLSSLSGLVAFLSDAGGDKYDLLLSTAPYVSEHHGAYDFLKELRRLVDGNPKEVVTVLGIFIETHEPMYDYHARMRKLVARIAELGHRAEAIAFCDKRRTLPGLYELYLELTAKPPAAM